MNILIIHGWGATAKSDWFPFVKNKLTKKEYNVDIPLMPNTDKPKINKWVGKLKKLNPTKNTIIVGHSVGCQTILRYLEKENKIFNKIILVAPWVTIKEENADEDEPWEIAKPWAETPIDFNKIKNKSKKFIIIYSENDIYGVKKDIFDLKDKLNAKIVNLGKKGHICQEDGITQLPELIKEIVN